MDVEYTGRHYEVTPANRKEVEAGLAKLRKILRNKFDAKVILAVEKRRHNTRLAAFLLKIVTYFLSSSDIALSSQPQIMSSSW